LRVVLSEEQLRQGVRRLAAEIRDHYPDGSLTIVGVLTGSMVLVADLIRLLDMPLRVGVVQARSYRGPATSPGRLAINSDFLPEIRGRHVLVVDDIFDTGNTLFELLIQLDELQPASLRSAVLLRKQCRSRVAIQPDHVAFDIPDEFVVGYGLDFEDAYRNLPYVAALEAAELSAKPQP
jgi:hypoxanthine phosphoribosyltransferase